MEEALPPGVERSVYGVYLVVERGKDKGTVFPITRQVTSLGRSETDIVINDADVSRRHAALEIQGQSKYVLRDLASTNGTLLNGIRVTTDSVLHNDKIRMGSTSIKLIVGDGKVAVELRRILGR
jgi:S-DNA-T family DNA segregation ATPase FtsK/SpoIIIE